MPDKKVLSVLKMLYSRKSSVSMLEYFIIVPILIVVTALWLFGFYLFVHVAGGILMIAHKAVFAWNEPTVLEVVGRTIGPIVGLIGARVEHEKRVSKLARRLQKAT